MESKNLKSLFENITQALQTMEHHFGPEVFGNPARFIAGINDLVDKDAKPLKHLLRISICDLNAYNKLKKALEENNTFAAKHLVAEMSDGYMIPPEVSGGVIDCIAIFVGFKPSEEPPAFPEHIVSTLKPQPISRPIFKTPPPAIMTATKREPSFVQSIEYSHLAPKKIGETMHFGGREWLILDINVNGILILSNKVITTKKYHEKNRIIEWQNCTLRQYLNITFYSTFTNEEQSRIIKTTTSNPINPWFATKDGGETTDKIFILSIEETAKYLGVSSQLKTRPPGAGHIDDQYNKSRIAKDTNNTNCWWWLRSPGFDGNRAAFISARGSLYMYGGMVIGDGGVRPVMWITA